MDDRPRNVKELLTEAKDTSEIMVDLAYAAVFFNEEDLAEEVERLEEILDGLLRRLREISMLAARSPEDADAMARVLHIAAALEKNADAAIDSCATCSCPPRPGWGSSPSAEATSGSSSPAPTPSCPRATSCCSRAPRRAST
jgi:hypothetical protein